MTKLPFAAALLALASAASAQSFDAGLADVSESVKKAFSVQGMPTTYAVSIVCANPPQDSGLPKDLKFYTRLGRKLPKNNPSDDTASLLNDYLGSGVREGRWHFDAWSCDTTDYWFDFAMSDLVRGSKDEKSRPVKGHVKIETRGRTDFDGPLDCVAYW